jgi:hypothetical protein
VELYEPREVWPAKLGAALREADRHGAALDVRVVSDSADGVVQALSSALGGSLSRIVRLGFFHPGTQCTDPAAWTALKPSLAEARFSGQLLAGTRSHFTELNRWIAGGSDGSVTGSASSPVPRDADALTFSLAPQVHSTEVPHIVETVPVQRLAAANALKLGEGRPVHVGPITLKPRLHAPDQQAEGDELQDHNFTAAWTLASLAALTVDGVASVTYFEADPPRGITAADGTLNPAGELLQKLVACKGDPVLAATPAQKHPAETSPVTVYPVQSAAGLQLFVGNLSPREATAVLSLPGGANAAAADVTVIGAAAGAARVEAVQAEASSPGSGALAVTLGPWATAVVSFRG